MRGVEAVSDSMLRITLGAATEETLLTDPSQYALETAGGSLTPVAAVRRSEREVAIPGTGWPFQTYWPASRAPWSCCSRRNGQQKTLQQKTLQ